MISKPLPTGEEPPSGFESIYEDFRAANEDPSVIKINRVSATQLSSSEIKELERLRKRAIEAIENPSLERGFEITFEREMNLWPEGKTPTDKLVFRDFDDVDLRGYALVVRGWPTPKTWTIQHLIVDPEVRLRGIGKRIVASVELDALSSTDTTSAIVAVPVSSSNDSFWEHNGFERAGEKSIELSGNEYSFGIFKKIIR